MTTSANKFSKERQQVLNAVSKGIKGNLKLSSKQKKYIKPWEQAPNFNFILTIINL